MYNIIPYVMYLLSLIYDTFLLLIILSDLMCMKIFGNKTFISQIVFYVSSYLFKKNNKQSF